MRRAAKRDGNEKPIVTKLREHGYLVMYLNEFDLLVSAPLRKQVWMIEVKTEDGELKESQKKMIADGWPLHIVRSVEDALAVVKP